MAMLTSAGSSPVPARGRGFRFTRFFHWPEESRMAWSCLGAPEGDSFAGVMRSKHFTGSLKARSIWPIRLCWMPSMTMIPRSG